MPFLRTKDSWLNYLNGEDAAFLKRFTLASGSLKDLASAYDVTYPTIRLRLDRLIKKIEVLDNEEFGNPFERQLRSLFAEGKLDFATFQEIHTAYRSSQPKDE